MSQSKIENKVIIDGQTYYGGLNQPNLKFIKVNCWERIFDFLSLQDILAMSQTCQRMRQIGGHYYRQNFHGSPYNLSYTDLSISFYDIPIASIDFLRFIDKLYVQEHLEHLRTVSSMGLLGSLTSLHLAFLDLNEHQLRGIENIQTNIETIELRQCHIHDASFGEFLALCPKLKYLEFNYIIIKSTEAAASLFQRTYSKLEYFACTFYEEEFAPFEWTSFLARNPSIKGIAIEIDALYKIPLENTSSVQLDYLNISFDSHPGDQPAELANRLKALHSNGWYKTLRLPFTYDEAFVNELVSFSVLEFLDCFSTNLCHFTGLKELQFSLNDRDIDLPDLQTIAINLINLERLSIGCTADQLLPFFRHSKKLQMVIYWDTCNPFDALNLCELNVERQMGQIKRKIQIGVREEAYLATKWMTKNLSYELVEIVRMEKISKHFFRP